MGYQEDRANAIQAAMSGAYDPLRQYNNWKTLEYDYGQANSLDDIGVNVGGDAGHRQVTGLSGGGQLGRLGRQRDIALGRSREDQGFTNLMDRGNYGARGISGSGLMTARNAKVQQGYARQRDDLNLGFSDKSSELLKQARDLVGKFNIEQQQRYEDFNVKTPLSRLGQYSF
jgi:hypothetical protein